MFRVGEDLGHVGGRFWIRTWREGLSEQLEVSTEPCAAAEGTCNGWVQGDLRASRAPKRMKQSWEIFTWSCILNDSFTHTFFQAFIYSLINTSQVPTKCH